MKLNDRILQGNAVLPEFPDMDWSHLNSQRLPGRINAELTASFLGFREEPDIQVLMRAKLLKPLGNPAPNGTKWFSSVEILQLAADKEWLHKATLTIQKFWKSKHAKETLLRV